MNKFKIKALVAATLLVGVACGASAQSNINISGKLDLAMVHTDGSGTKIDQAGNGGNELVFSGSEDIGNGIKANFRLASRFSPESGGNDGTNNARPLFQGESTVGLSGQFGSIKAGRSLTAFQESVNATAVNGLITQGSTANLSSGYSTDPLQGDRAGANRTDGFNFKSPTWNGLTAAVTLGLKSSAASGATVTGANNLTSAWVRYDRQDLMVGVGSEKNRAGDSVQAILGTYKVGIATVGYGFSTVDVVSTVGDKGKNWNTTVSAPFGPYSVQLGYYNSKAEGTGLQTQKSALALDYTLSKRTAIYTSYGVTHKENIASVSGYDVGIRHAF